MKKLTFLALALLLAVSCVLMLPTEAQAARVANGYCASGDALMWWLEDNGTLTICGTSPFANSMGNYRENEFPWQKLKQDITTLVIMDGALTVSDHAFSDCDNLTSVTFPKGLERIGASAFWGCSALTEIHIPAKVNRIGDKAFLPALPCRASMWTNPIPISATTATAFYTTRI